MPVAPDPYLPGHGDIRYAVEHYELTLEYKVATNRLDARATLNVRAAEATDAIRLDLAGLSVARVLVDGRQPKKWTHKARHVDVRLVRTLHPGERVEVTVVYSGKPGPVGGPHGHAGWEELTDGVLVASQPYGSPSWFPCNDRADDKATYRITIGAESEYWVKTTGVLVAESVRGGRTTRTYVMDAPTSPYLVCVNIGRLTLTHPAPVPSTMAHPTPRITVAHPGPRPAPEATVNRLPAMMETLQEWFGPYPFTDFTAVVVDDVLEIPLEAQASASFGRNHLRPGWENERLVVHELAHQWFGNAVTSALMSDIWLHEGFACYTEWLWSEHRGQGTTRARAMSHWNVLKGQRQPTRLSDPSARHMFDDWVYKRGALTLHALRRTIGDDAFFGSLRSWVRQYSGRAASTADFVRVVSRHTCHDVRPLFSAWLNELALPQLPPEP